VPLLLQVAAAAVRPGHKVLVELLRRMIGGCYCFHLAFGSWCWFVAVSVLLLHFDIQVSIFKLIFKSRAVDSGP
jgi:hypothetical protein